MMATGLSQPKKMPSIAELNPYRRDEIEDGLDDWDKFEADIAKAMR